MKLYYMPGACSLAPHIALREAGLRFDLESVGRDKKTENGEDYLAVNPKGSVPALKLDNGEVLTEAGVVQQYIADQAHKKKLAPPAGTPQRYRLQEWLNYNSSEVHKGIGQLFNPAMPDDYKEAVKKALGARQLPFLDRSLTNKGFLLDSFSVADCYLFCGSALDRGPQDRYIRVPTHSSLYEAGWRAASRTRGHEGRGSIEIAVM